MRLKYRYLDLRRRPLQNNLMLRSKVAKITSAKTSSKLTIKALKKGTITIKVKVNGVKTFKIKVKVV